MPRPYKPARDHLIAVEAALHFAPKSLTAKEIAVLCDIDPKRASGFLSILAAEHKVHSLPSGVKGNGRVWAIGKAPEIVKPADYDEEDKESNSIPVRRIFKSTWDAIMLRDPLVSALFGAPQVMA
jgi:hypothetical protein